MPCPIHFPRRSSATASLLLLCAPLLFACHGGDDPASSSAAPAAGNTVAYSIAEGANLLAYVGQTKTVTLSFRSSDGAAATKLNLSMIAAPGWQAPADALSCAKVDREGSCVIRLSYAPTQPAAAAALRLPYTYVDSAGANQSGSVTLSYRALAANAAVASVTPNPVPGIVNQQSVLTLDFSTNDGSPASALSVSYALPAAWSSDVADFTCPSFGGGTTCRLSLRYVPTQATPSSSFKIGYSYVDSAGKPQSDALSIVYSAVAPNSAQVAIGGANLPSPSLIAVDPGGSQDVSFTFTSSDGNALADLKLDPTASLPAGWSADAALSAFSCATVTQVGKCQLVLHFQPAANQILLPQTLTLKYTYRNAVGQSQSDSTSIDYTSKIYRLYAAGQNAAAGGVSQCWLNMPDGVGKYDLSGCDDPTLPSGVTSMAINGSSAYLLEATSLVDVCTVRADGAVGDCIDQFTAPGKANFISWFDNGLYFLSAQGAGAASLYGCVPGSAAKCDGVAVNVTGTKTNSFTRMANDGTTFYLLDSSNGLLFPCTRVSTGMDLQCGNLRPDPSNYYANLAAGQIGGSGQAYLGANTATGPLVVKCMSSNNKCTSSQPAGGFPTGASIVPLTLIDMKFAHNGASDPALYLLLGDPAGNSRGIVRCALATATTSTNQIGDLLSCGKYTPILQSTATAPTSIEIR